MRPELAFRRIAVEAQLCRRFERAKAEGDLPADSHPADLARFVATAYQGMAVQATAGKSRTPPCADRLACVAKESAYSAFLQNWRFAVILL